VCLIQRASATSTQLTFQQLHEALSAQEIPRCLNLKRKQEEFPEYGIA
jgi:hypothetical protein